jgi:hypothetical protein
MFSLPVRRSRPLRCVDSDASLNSAFCSSVSVLFFQCSTNAKESYPWNGPHLSTKKSI